MEYDVVIVGAGPAGISAAIRLIQLADQHQRRLKICVLEKGARVGAHLLSGAVLETRALQELFPDWQKKSIPLDAPVTKDQFLWLSEKRTIPLPTPTPMKNKNNYIVRLGTFTAWLAKEAEKLGVDLFPGFAVTDLLYDTKDNVIGVKTGDFGIDKQGHPKPTSQPGIDIRARYTLLAEGARGSLTQKIMEKYRLRETCDPQTYGIGIKELWEIPSQYHRPGSVMHTIGWPLDNQTYGGSFIYHLNNQLLSIGFVVGLDYQNPYLDPFYEFQRFKHHPYIQQLLEGGKRLAYGARALNEGGFQSIPKLHFPGGLIIGCAAGFLNVPKIKGIHTAMKSGMLAAETVFDGFVKHRGLMLSQFDKALHASWVGKELKKARNIRPAFKWGTWQGVLYSALDTYLLRGHAPWTLSHSYDHSRLRKKTDCKKISYPKPDGIISFDKTTSLSYANVNHTENQPCHLHLKDPDIPINTNLALYDAPEQRYCPAEVYEIVYDTKQQNPRLQINAQNCIHCKTCDIKDPMQNITWVPPEGGGGPNYSGM